MTADADLRAHGRWLVTGGGGFVAANLARDPRLADAEFHLTVRDPGGWRLRELDPRITRHRVDLRDAARVSALVADLRPEVIVHAATWRPGGDGAGGLRAAAVAGTIAATAHLVDAALRHPPRRFVHLGSSLELGHRDTPLHEDLPLRPTTLHGAVKAAATLLVRQAAGDGLPATVLRCFSIYGPWEGPSRLIPTAIRAIRDGRVLPLTAPGPVRDFVYAGDVVGAVLRAATTDVAPGTLVHVGSGVEVPNEEVVATIAAVLGREPRLAVGRYPTRASDAARWVTTTGRARELLGWRATTPFADGIARTVDWVLRHDAVAAAAVAPR